MSDKVSAFYDAYSAQQVAKGINARHLRIMEWLEKFGLRPDAQVLEIGCGVGTQTELIAKALRNGHLLANDISPRSVDLARERLKRTSNVTFLTGDIIGAKVEGTFDLIVLPDVLEHIPREQHGELFLKLSKLLAPKGNIVIHIPAPEYLEHLHRERPELLQVIDQALPIAELAPKFTAAGLYLHYLEQYPLWTDEDDACVLCLRHSLKDHAYRTVAPPISPLARVKGTIRKLLK